MGSHTVGFANGYVTPNNNLVTLNSGTDLTLNSVTVVIKMYNTWSGSFSLQLFVGALANGTV